MYCQYQFEQHIKVGIVFKGALAEADVEVVFTLYQMERGRWQIVVTNWKARLKSRSLWSIL